MKLSRHQQIYFILKGRDQDSALSVSHIHRALLGRIDEKVSRKSIDRDLIEMSQTHKLLATETYPVRFYTSAEFSPDYSLQFSQEELQTVFLALESMKKTSPKYISNLSKKVTSTLLQKLPKPLADEMVKFRSIHYFGYGSNGRAVAKDNKSLGIVLKAHRRRRCFTCHYESPYTKRDKNNRLRNFAPILFQLTGGIPYLYVKDLDDGKLKNLRATRITNAKMTDSPVGLNPRIHENDLDSSFGGYGGKETPLVKYKITAKFPVASFFSEREIHPSQKITGPRTDSLYEISFTSVESNEIERLIRSFGDDVVTTQKT